MRGSVNFFNGDGSDINVWEDNLGKNSVVIELKDNEGTKRKATFEIEDLEEIVRIFKK